MSVRNRQQRQATALFRTGAQLGPISHRINTYGNEFSSELL